MHIKRVFMVIGASFRLKESGSAEVSVQITAIDKSQSAGALLLNGQLRSKETVVGCYAHLISLCNTIKLQHMEQSIVNKLEDWPLRTKSG